MKYLLLISFFLVGCDRDKYKVTAADGTIYHPSGVMRESGWCHFTDPKTNTEITLYGNVKIEEE